MTSERGSGWIDMAAHLFLGAIALVVLFPYFWMVVSSI